MLCVKSSDRYIVESLNRIADVTVHDSRFTPEQANRVKQNIKKTNEEK
jgi:hypothetical protein